ncbi:MAG TPA: cytochrome c [Candidatus Angelobacter sp.]|nr:cytochrome c [Candidatus Angelobacter sp.]
MKPVQIWVLMICVLLSATLLLAAPGDGLWLKRVPEKDRARRNPYAGKPAAQAAGARLFKLNCSSCHGDDAQGKDHHPSLHSERVRNATPGELQWLLTNGSMKNGMPSWSRLPEPQRWQIISFLKSLSAADQVSQQTTR